MAQANTDPHATNPADPNAQPPTDATSTNPGPQALPLLPIPAGVIFPGMVVTVALESAAAQAAAEAATENEIVLVPKVEGSFSTIGVIARIEDRGTLRNGLPALTLRATSRAVVGAGIVGTSEALWVNATPVAQLLSERTPALAEAYRGVAESLLARLGGSQMATALPAVDHAAELADTIAYWPELTLLQRVELLETIDVDQRLELATAWAKQALQEVTVAQTIREEVASSLENDQREVLLRRQLAAIQDELGEGASSVIAEFRAKLDELGDAISTKTREAISTELDRFERVGEQSQEGSWIRTWLDTIFELPWGQRVDDNLDLGQARETLDADHTGLDEVKDRIVEHLAVRKLRAERDQPDETVRPNASILTMVGPPGVGKTSLGESIAASLGRPFVRMALGGIRDEAEIRGHRRTYVGARPGRVVRALSEAGAMNPVILLDEIDKLGADWRGDPSSALLEVLDPAQNHSFRDHYLEFELDLSDVVFLATANRVDTIPAPLLDRVELIELDGYTDDEKTVIASRHLVPKLRKQMALSDNDVLLPDELVAKVAADWTREAGVRNLERKLATILRKAATKIAVDPEAAPVRVTDEDLRDWLGRPIPREELSQRVDAPGVATGLAVTGAGGDVLFVEAAVVPDGEPGLTLTGQLGDVMKESGEIARSFLRANAAELGIDDANKRFHVHFPAGAVPKDGPSAGITMTTALVSLLTDRKVKPHVAMTGEVTLQGSVLPIGGVKQKLLAAHRAGITTVILPERNGPDLDDVPDEVLDAMTIHLVADVREVLNHALAGC